MKLRAMRKMILPEILITVLLTACGMANAADSERMELTDFLSVETGLCEAGTLRIRSRIFEKDGIVCFGVMHGNELRFEKGGRGFTWQDDAAGGATVACLDYIEFPVDISRTGEYQLWYRAFFPSRGTWLHFETMDDGDQIRNIDNPNDPELTGRWVWVKGPRYNLTRKRHVWKLGGWRGGALLDKVVFALDPNFTPEDNGPAYTCELAAMKAHFVSGEIDPGVKRWGEVSWETSEPGSVKCFVSADGTANWREVKNGDNLGDIVDTRGGVYLRFALVASKSDISPIVRNIVVCYDPDPSLFKTLENEDMKLVFSPRGIREIIDKKTGVAFRPPTMTTEFFRLKIKKPGYGALEELSASKDAKTAALSVANNVLTGEYHFLDGKVVIRPVVRIEDGSLSRWKMAIENNSDMEIAEIQFPFLRSLKVGEQGEDDILIVNSVWGQIIRNPAKWQQRYPFTPSLRFMTLYDDKSGIYIADHNTNFDSFNDVAMYVIPSEDGTGIDLNWTKFLRVPPGGRRNVENFVVAIHGGGSWHEAADIYRDEVVSKLRQPFYPEWAKWTDGWSNVNAFWPGYGFNVLQRYLEDAKESGLLFMGGNRLGMSSPAYGYGGYWPYPTPAGGTTAELRQYLDEIREEGGDTNFYIAVNLHSPRQCVDEERIAGYAPKSWMEPDTRYHDYEFYYQNASRASCGSIAPVGRNMVTQYAMCPGARGWKDFLKYWTIKYVRDYGAHIYWDCTSCGIAYGLAGICANLDHDHDDYGAYYSDCTKILEETAKVAREIDPDYVFSGESANDIIGQSGVLHMCSGVINRTEIFRYTVPGQICLDGVWNDGLRNEHGGYRKFHHVFLTGCRFDGLPGNSVSRETGDRKSKYGNGSKTRWEFGLEMLALRRQTKQYLYPARFMDTVGLSIYSENGLNIPNPRIDENKVVQTAPVDGVQAKWFLLNTGYDSLALVNCLNDDNLRGNRATIAANRIPEVRKAWAFDLDGKVTGIDCVKIDEVWSFPLPETTLSTVVLVNRAFPCVRIDEGFGVSVTASGEIITPKIHIRNLEATPGEASLSWDAPSGCKAERVETGILQPGEEKVLSVPLTIASGVSKGRHDMFLRMNWRGQQQRVYHRLSVTDPVLARLSEDSQKNLTLKLRNISGKEQHVKGTIAVNAPLSPSNQEIELVLKPWEEKSLTVGLSGWRDVKLPLRANAELKVADMEITKSLLMYPYVPNGDFEADEAGDLRPDWWICWSDRGTGENYHHLRLDPDRKVSGKYSLRLEPHESEDRYVMAQPMVSRPKANTKYRVSVDIYRTENSGGAWAQIQGLTLGNKDFKPNEWQRFEGIFQYENPEQFPDRNVAYDWVRWIRLFNRTRSPVWFDNLIIEEIEK